MAIGGVASWLMRKSTLQKGCLPPLRASPVPSSASGVIFSAMVCPYISENLTFLRQRRYMLFSMNEGRYFFSSCRKSSYPTRSLNSPKEQTRSFLLRYIIIPYRLEIAISPSPPQKAGRRNAHPGHAELPELFNGHDRGFPSRDSIEYIDAHRGLDPATASRICSSDLVASRKMRSAPASA